MLGIRILIRFDPDLFGQLRILERAIAVRGLIFYTPSQIVIRVKANPPDLRTLSLHLQMRYYTLQWQCHEIVVEMRQWSRRLGLK
jgi:hypothetical protein